MWFVFQTAMKTKEGKITFSGEENSKTIPFEVCAKLHFSIFFKLVSQEPNSLVLSYPKCWEACQQGSWKAEHWSKQFANLLGLFIGAVESTDILMEVHTQHSPEANWHQLPISTNLLTSTNQKKQVSLDGKYIPAFLSLTHMRYLKVYP